MSQIDGQTFLTQEGPIQIVDIGPETYTVTDPTKTNPQHSRAGTWEIDKRGFLEGLAAGDVRPAKLDATPRDTDTVVFELPLSAEDTDLTVDALFTALDHATAYHDYEGEYADMYERLEEKIFSQVQEQLND